MLYKELYFRHIYSKLTPTLEQRIASFANYRALFDYLWGACSCAAGVCCSCLICSLLPLDDAQRRPSRVRSPCRTSGCGT